MTEDELFEDVRFWKGRTDAAKAEIDRLLSWCATERHRLGGVDGYDYKSGEEFGIRRVEIQIEKAMASLSDMTKDRT